MYRSARQALKDMEDAAARVESAGRSNVKRTYALAEYTVETKGEKWYFWRTARYGDKEERHGPYGSIASVTLMIARELGKEVARRHGRIQ